MNRPRGKHCYHKYLHLSRSERKRIRWVSIQEWRRKRGMYRRKIGEWTTTMITRPLIELDNWKMIEQQLTEQGIKSMQNRIVIFYDHLTDSNS